MGTPAFFILFLLHFSGLSVSKILPPSKVREVPVHYHTQVREKVFKGQNVIVQVPVLLLKCQDICPEKFTNIQAL